MNNNVYIITFLESKTNISSEWVDNIHKQGFAKVYVICDHQTVNSIKVNENFVLVNKSDLIDTFEDNSNKFVQRHLLIQALLNSLDIEKNDWFINLEVNEFIRLSNEFDSINSFLNRLPNKLSQVVINNFELIKFEEHIYRKKNRFMMPQFQRDLLYKSLGFKPYYTGYDVGKTLFRPKGLAGQNNLPCNSFVFSYDVSSSLEASYFDIWIEMDSIKDVNDFINTYRHLNNQTESEYLGLSEVNNFTQFSKKIIETNDLNRIEKYFRDNFLWTAEELELLRKLKVLIE